MKSIEVEFAKFDLNDDQEIVLRIGITDGEGVFKAGNSDTYQTYFEINTEGLHDIGFFIDMENGDPAAIEKGDIFWYMVEKSIYEDPDSTMLDAALAAGDLVESEGFRTDRSDFRPTNNRTKLYLDVRTNGSGSSTKDKAIYFIYAQYTGEEVADFSTLKCASEDIQELAKKELVFLRGK